MLIYFGGVPGVGKTSIIKEIVKLGKEHKINLEHVVGSKIMCKLAGVNSVDKLRNLPEVERKKYRPKINEIVYGLDRKDSNKIRLCDGHFCYYEKKGKKFGIRPISSKDDERIKIFVVILADENIILERRIKEFKIRPDRQISIVSIKNEQDNEIKHAVQQAKIIGLPILFVTNNNEHNFGTSINLILKTIQI